MFDYRELFLVFFTDPMKPKQSPKDAGHPSWATKLAHNSANWKLQVNINLGGPFNNGGGGGSK